MHNRRRRRFLEQVRRNELKQQKLDRWLSRRFREIIEGKKPVHAPA